MPKEIAKQTIKYISYLMRNRLIAPPEKRIVFIHLHKCGGTSIHSAISRLYPEHKYFQLSANGSTRAAQTYHKASNSKELGENLHRYRTAILHYQLAMGVPYIGGHFRFRRDIYEAYGEHVNFLTMLRDPVDRWISNYFYKRYNFNNPSQKSFDDSLNECINSHRGGNFGSRMVRFLAGEYTKSPDITETIEKAKNNLHLFSIVGFLDQLDDFKNQFHRDFGRKLIIPKKRINPRDKGAIEKELNDNHIERIQELCQPDIELYSYAKEKFSISNKPI